ncbi:hypothetical protein ACQUW5_14800 [Legionella sp. CNM-1927-20]|uniref:hypothetical protein n=1 Tax=Legionella sp. CNM-1927-20 TaxID=3422221 RepID=UPI00403A8AD7
MKTKLTFNSHRKINEIRQNIAAFEKRERDEIFNSVLKLISPGSNNNNAGELSNEILGELFEELCEKYKPRGESKKLIDTWKKYKNTQEKIIFFAKFISEGAKIPSGDFIENISRFLQVFINDNELNLFLANPQLYIDNHPNIAAHDLQILQFIINDPRFNNFPSIGRNVSPNTFISTPLTKGMYQLNLPDYTSTDAVRFPQCINTYKRDAILEKAKKAYYGPSVVGTGALPNYNRKAIEQTAKNVRKMKMGDCHSFAQLAADHFLTLIEKNHLRSLHIKMVSHDNGLGSHTFLLVDHNSDNLNDLSNCLIVDPWAVVMGHTSTYGIYTLRNYPFPNMLTKLVCCYDNQTQTSESSNSGLSPSKEISLKEVSQTLTSRSFFSRESANLHERGLSKKQKTVIEFLNILSKNTANSVKRDLLNELITSIESEQISPEKGARLAVLAFHAKMIEKTDTKYLWKNLISVDEALVDVFNKEPIINYWLKFSEKNNLPIQTDQKLNRATIEKIIGFLNQTEDHEFSKTTRIRANTI